MLESFLIKLQALRTATLLKRDSCKTSEILKKTLFYWTCPVAASDSFRFPACNFIKKENLAKICFCEFYEQSCKFLWTSFDRTPLGDCFLSFSVNFEKFFRTSHLQSTFEKVPIPCLSCSISTSRYYKKLFHRCSSRVLYKNEK